MKNAKYWGIVPCWYNPEGHEIIGKNWWYRKTIDVLVWVDIHFNREFMFTVEEE